MEKSIRRERRSRQQIIDLLELFKTSGSSVKDFCSSHGISKAAFHKWQSRAKNNPASQGSTAFAKVHIEEVTTGALFAQVGAIRLYQLVPASYLKELAG